MNAQSTAHEGEGVWVTTQDFGVDEVDRLVKHLAESLRNLASGCALLAAERKVGAATVVAENFGDLKVDGQYLVAMDVVLNDSMRPI